MYYIAVLTFTAMGKDLTLVTEKSYVASDLLTIIEPTMVRFSEAIELYHACENLPGDPLTTVRAIVDIAHYQHLPVWAAVEVWLKTTSQQ